MQHFVHEALDNSNEGYFLHYWKKVTLYRTLANVLKIFPANWDRFTEYDSCLSQTQQMDSTRLKTDDLHKKAHELGHKDVIVKKMQ